MSDWGSIKAAARQQVHTTFALRALYRETQDAAPITLGVRLHTRVQANIQGMAAGYAQIIEGVSNVIFDKDELIANNVIPKANAFLTFPDQIENFQLDTKDADSGAVVEKWSVTRL